MIQMNTIKTIFNALLLMSTLSKVNGTVRQFHLHLYGEVSEEYGPHVLGQIPNVSKSVCASMCLENAKCHAVEICNQGVSECRITTGQHLSPMSNSSRSTCQLYRLGNPCREFEGYWDRLQNTCTQNITQTLPPNTCADCHCLLGLLDIVLTNGEIRSTLSGGKTLVCVVEVAVLGLDIYKWTVIQRRRSGGSVDFDREWNEYKEGFGSTTSDFWIGNDFIHQLTNITGNHHLQIRMTKNNGQKLTVEYLFYIESENGGYRLHAASLDGSQNPGDPFLSTCQECANLMKFSTKDVDNDNDTIRNCASVSKGGWWHNSCQRSNLNGEFGQGNYTLGINWNTFTDLSYVEMRVRRP